MNREYTVLLPCKLRTVDYPVGAKVVLNAVDATTRAAVHFRQIEPTEPETPASEATKAQGDADKAPPGRPARPTPTK